MIKVFFSFFLFVCILGAAKLDVKIKKETKSLQKAKNSKVLFSKSLKNIAKEILRTGTKLKSTKTKIIALDKTIKDQKNIEETKKKELGTVKSKVSSLSSLQKSIKTEIANIVIKELSFDIIKTGQNEDIQSFINKDIIDVLSTSYNRSIKNLQKRFNVITSKIASNQKELNKLQVYIGNLQKKRKSLFSLRKKQTFLVQKLKTKKKLYDKKFASVKAQEKLLKRTLAKLNILKKNELTKDSRDKQRIANKLSKTKVRQVGSSYKRSLVSSYRGKKVRAPLQNYSVKRKFGKYYDPIYKITTFNDSILLHSKVFNAKIRAMFLGKVVFKSYTKILKNIVVVQSQYGVNVVYANMSKIAPTIKVGSRIKKGYVIGRVEQDLSLSVTQNNKYVDPLKVFK